MAETWNTNLLPTATGLDLGSPSKQWDAHLRDVIIYGTFTAPNLVAAALATASQIVSTLPDGTAPLSVLSQTKVANLNVDLLDGKDWASPAAIGTSAPAAANFTTLGVSGQITSSLATGTAPINVASTTKCPNLNADLLDGSDWTAPPAIGGTTPVPSLNVDTASITSIANTNLSAAHVTVTGDIAQNGAGMKMKSITTGSVPAGSGVDVTITWTTAFASANYFCWAIVEEATTGGSTLTAAQLESKTTTQVKFRVRNADAVTARTGTLVVLAIMSA